MTTPTKHLDLATLMKMRSGLSMGSGGRPLKVAEQETGPGECEGDGLDNEEHDNPELSQGEEEVDKTPSPHAPTRHGMQVAIQDTLEHMLVAGKWAGLGAVRKVNEVRIKVSGFRPHQQARATKVCLQGQLVYRSVMCGPCAKGDKTCYSLDGHPCGQCMYVQQEDVQAVCHRK